MKVTMCDRQGILKKAQSATLLDSRIAENVGSQRIDLVEWIFDRITVEQGSRVLELCCGTGSQTLLLLDLVGQVGRVVALDISHQALEKLVAKVKMEWRLRLTLVESDMDKLRWTLERDGLEPPWFDMAFCAYGLYYSTDAIKTLLEVKHWLRPKGRIIVIGPFGPNNAPLFDLLEQGGVVIPTYVRYTSADFMFKEVVPWATQHFEVVSINTVVNRVAWKEIGNVLEYWRNTTFYDSERLPAIERLLNEHFKQYPEFVNEKWIMMIEAANART